MRSAAVGGLILLDRIDYRKNAMSLLAVLAVAVAIAVRAQRAGDAWGTNIHWTNPQPGEAAQLAAAFRVVRMDVDWAGIEKSGACGSYDFSAYDSLVATLEAQSPPVRLYAIIDYCKNACYDGGAVCKSDACFAAYASFGGERSVGPTPVRNPCASPHERAHFRAHTGALMKRYAGKGVVFEIMNEPNGG